MNIIFAQFGFSHLNGKLDDENEEYWTKIEYSKPEGVVVFYVQGKKAAQLQSSEMLVCFPFVQ